MAASTSSATRTGAARTGRPDCAPDSVEQGLRDLARDEGPQLSKLVNPYTSGLRALISLAVAHRRPAAPIDVTARALRQFIWEQIAGFSEEEHPKCKAALQAAFCIAPMVADGREFPSIAARLKVMTATGAFGQNAGPEAGLRNWRRAVKRLARLVEQNIGELRYTAAWASAGLPSGYQAVRVRSLVVTYYLTSQIVTDIITERTVEAVEDDVDRYIVRDYVQGSPDARIQVRALLNCATGTQTAVDLGPGFVGAKVEVLLPAAYRKGEGCTFATKVTRSGVAEPTTWQEIQVTSHGIDNLTMRAQFDLGVPPPSRCWYFAAVPDLGRLEPPGLGEQRDLDISRFGYVERHFGAGQATAKYGLVWHW